MSTLLQLDEGRAFVLYSLLSIALDAINDNLNRRDYAGDDRKILLAYRNNAERLLSQLRVKYPDIRSGLEIG